MAKALLGYVDGDAGARQQARALRRRVHELEARVRRLEAEKRALGAALRDRDSLQAAAVDAEREPAYS